MIYSFIFGRKGINEQLLSHAAVELPIIQLEGLLPLELRDRMFDLEDVLYRYFQHVGLWYLSYTSNDEVKEQVYKKLTMQILVYPSADIEQQDRLNTLIEEMVGKLKQVLPHLKTV